MKHSIESERYRRRDYRDQGMSPSRLRNCARTCCADCLSLPVWWGLSVKGFLLNERRKWMCIYLPSKAPRSSLTATSDLLGVTCGQSQYKDFEDILPSRTLIRKWFSTLFFSMDICSRLCQRIDQSKAAQKKASKAELTYSSQAQSMHTHQWPREPENT